MVYKSYLFDESVIVNCSLAWERAEVWARGTVHHIEDMVLIFHFQGEWTREDLTEEFIKTRASSIVYTCTKRPNTRKHKNALEQQKKNEKEGKTFKYLITYISPGYMPKFPPFSMNYKPKNKTKQNTNY